ncbi:MAG TPA: hypothetical protein VIW03_01750 [Anaeromyxobacter sp.]
MATKAERFRYEAERSGPKKPKAPPRPPRNSPVDTSLPGKSATDRRATRKESAAAGRKAMYAFEASGTGRPSRKSTRKAKNRQRTDAQMRVKRRTAAVRPETRAGRGW